jgi:hypothetical protein
MEGKVKIPGWRGSVPRKERILLAVVLILSIVLTSCSGLAGAPTLTLPPPVPTSTIPPTLTPLPPTRLNIGIESSKLTGNILEFILSNQPTFGDSIVAGFTHPGLFKIDPNTGNLIKAVAASDLQEWLPNGNTWEMDVVLNPDMKWNNGTPISSEDVVFSINTIKTLTRYQTGINHTNVETLSISPTQPGSVKITLSKDPSMLIGLKSVLSFPILNHEYWKGIVDQIQGSEEFKSLGIISDELLTNQSMRSVLEQQQNILIQQVSDAVVILDGTKVSLKYMQDYVDNKDLVNKNGVKDSEIASSYTMQIPGLTHLVVLINDIYVDQLSQLINIQEQLKDLLTAQTNMIRQYDDLVVSVSTIKTENGSTEPLLIPYRLETIKTAGENTVVLTTLSHQEAMPDLITFTPGEKAILLDLFSKGELDTILTGNHQGAAPGNSPYTSFPTVTGMFFNPKSDQLLFPVLRTAISCIYSSPEIWADEPKPGDLILITPFIPPSIEKDAIECTGDLPTRLNSMLELFKISGYTWQVDQTGMILPGTFTDPRGKIIPSLQINVSPSVNFPAAVQEKFKRSILNLGIEVTIQAGSDNNSEMIISESTTTDIIIAQWISTEQGEVSLCGIIPQLINSGFPGYLLNDINSKCQTDSAGKDISPAPSPTPPVMVSGKIAKSKGFAQPWLTLMYGSYPTLEWVSGFESKYDISWLKALSPVWISGWGY